MMTQAYFILLPIMLNSLNLFFSKICRNRELHYISEERQGTGMSVSREQILVCVWRDDLLVWYGVSE